MTKKEFIKSFQENLHDVRQVFAAKGQDVYFTFEHCEMIYDDFCAALMDAIKDGGIKLDGIGTLTCKERKSRTGVYQFGEHKGETFVVPPRMEPVLRPSQALKDFLNE